MFRLAARSSFRLPTRSPRAIRVSSFASEQNKKHYERKLVQLPASDIFDIVADVDSYKEFVPWCQESRVLTRTTERMTAELVVGFGMLNESYISNIKFKRPSLVVATSSQTRLFDHLQTEWKFTPAKNPSSTWVTFQINFKFKSSLYDEMSKLFMKEVVDNMVDAFEKRCLAVRNAKLKPDNSTTILPATGNAVAYQ